jgi:predicted permease
MVYLFSKKLAPKEDFRTWLHGLVITLNIFFIIGMSFISLYNSTERFDFSRIGFIIYGSVGLVAAWALSWPVYLTVKRLTAKQPV